VVLYNIFTGKINTITDKLANLKEQLICTAFKNGVDVLDFDLVYRDYSFENSSATVSIISQPLKRP
jgi:hypothetical protein